MARNKVSMQTIADYLNVSKVTVYKALNNQPYVSEELREKILQAAAELGYTVKDKQESTLHNNLAFIVPKRFFLESDSFYTTIFYHLNNRCHKDGLTLTLYVIKQEDEQSCRLPITLSPENCDGIFIAGEMTADYIRAVDSLGLPTLLTDFYETDGRHDCVIADNFLNGFSAANYLIGKGHTQIGFVGRAGQTLSIADRFYGYRKALAAHGLEYNPQWHLSNNDPDTGVYALDIALPEELPTAFVCHCDRAAYFLIQRLQMAQLRVPEDISVISFDNTSLAENARPALTTVDISTKEIAKSAYAQLRKRIADNTIPPQRIYIPCGIIERDSVAQI
ncbi:MAG: LacI family DNA-binding transcriptional regulator [Faecousia sp.]